MRNLGFKFAQESMDSYPKKDSIDDGGYGAGKIFVGGLHWDTTLDAFREHFASYGEITDAVIMKDRMTSRPRGFGFVTFADPAAVAKVIEDTHTFKGKQVEIKRSIPKGMVPAQAQSKEFKTRKIFVGGIPSDVTEDEFKVFFSKYGSVVGHEIIWDRKTNHSRGFGFITFDSEEVVDQMLSMGNMIEMGDAKVEINKAKPKNFSNPQPASTYNRDPRGQSYNANFVYPYKDFNGGYRPSPYWSPRATGWGFDPYRYYSGNGGGLLSYRGYVDGSLGGYRGDPSFSYYSQVGSYNSNYGGDIIASSLGGSSLGGEGHNAGYSSGPDARYSGVPFGEGGRGGGNRYHPYAR